MFIIFFFVLKIRLKDLKFEFCQFKLAINWKNFVNLSCSRITVKLAINWKNFARARFQLKFAFIIRPSVSVAY